MKYFILVFTLCLSANAFGGPRVNSGGGGWMCSDALGARWIRSVDLFEAEGSRLRIAPVQGKTAKEILDAKMEKIRRELPSLDAFLRKYPVDLESAVWLWPIKLDSTEDASLMVRPRSATCAGGRIEYVQVANFLIDGTIIISAPLWRDPAFAEVEKAAILLHEILYKASRDAYGDENSQRARRITGLVFSDLGAEELRLKVADALSEFTKWGREDGIAPFAVKAVCRAWVENEWRKVQIEKTWEAKEFGSARYFELEGFAFIMGTAAEDGLFSSLSIEDKATGAETALASEDMRDILLKARWIRVKLRSRGLHAYLDCSVEDNR